MTCRFLFSSSSPEPVYVVYQPHRRTAGPFTETVPVPSLLLREDRRLERLKVIAVKVSLPMDIVELMARIKLECIQDTRRRSSCLLRLCHRSRGGVAPHQSPLGAKHSLTELPLETQGHPRKYLSSPDRASGASSSFSSVS